MKVRDTINAKNRARRRTCASTFTCRIALAAVAASITIPSQAGSLGGSTVNYSGISLLPSSRVMSPLAGQSAVPSTIRLGGTGPLLIPLRISQSGAPSLVGSGGTSNGVSFLYYSPGAGTNSAGSVRNFTAPSTFGFQNNLAFDAKSAKIGGAPSLLGTGALAMKGQVYLSNGSQAVAPGSNNSPDATAISEDISYKTKSLTVSATYGSVGKSFKGDDALKTALTGSDQATLNSLNDLLAKKGQNTRAFALNYGDGSPVRLSYAANDFRDTLKNAQSHSRSFAAGLGTDRTGKIDFSNTAVVDTSKKVDTVTRNLALGYGTADTGKFAFALKQTSDDINHKLEQMQTVSLDRTFATGFAVGLSHSTGSKQAAAQGASLNTTQDNFHLALSQARSAVALDAVGQMQQDTNGRRARQFAFTAKRNTKAYGVGIGFATDDNTPSSSGTTLSRRILSYQAVFKASRQLSVATDCRFTSFSGANVTDQPLNEQTTLIGYTPFKALTVSLSQIDKDRTTYRGIEGAYQVPNLAGLTGAKIALSVGTKDGRACGAANTLQKISFDGTCPKAIRELPMLAGASVHCELNDSAFSRSRDGKTVDRRTTMRVIRLASAPSIYKKFQWTYSLMSPTGKNVTAVPTLRSVEIKAPLSHGYAAEYSDYDQVVQPNSTAFKNSKQRAVRISGPFSRMGLRFTAEFTQGLEYANQAAVHRNGYGLTLNGNLSRTQKLAFGYSRQIDRIDGGGEGVVQTCKLDFTCAVSDSDQLSLAGTVDLYNYSNRVSLRSHADPTLKFDYIHAY